MKKLPSEPRGGLAKLIERYCAGESRFRGVKDLGDGIHEIRHRHLTSHYRALLMTWGRNYVCLTVFMNGQEATPKLDLDRAKDRAAKWMRAFGQSPAE